MARIGIIELGRKTVERRAELRARDRGQNHPATYRGSGAARRASRR
jgi:hypothetical protein